MPSPDYSPYIDLTIYDRDTQGIYDDAVALIQQTLPDWQPREGNTEVVLLEAVAQEVSEIVYAINRLPDGIMEALLQFFQISRDFGAAPTCDVMFHMAGTDGYTIPEGTRVSVAVEGQSDAIIFYTDVELTVNPGSSTGTVSATALDYTDIANGIASGTQVEILDSIIYADYATLNSTVIGGRTSEGDDDYIERGVNRFNRLSSTLVLPSDFESAALENPGVTRAKALDMFALIGIDGPALTTATPATTGGTLAAGTYYYAVSVYNVNGESTPATPTTATTTGTTGQVTLTWAAPSVPYGVPAITGYYVYRGTASNNLKQIATVAAGTLTYVDTGSAGTTDPPTSNTTGPAYPGSLPGHVLVVLYGPDGPVTTSTKSQVQSVFDASSAAILDAKVGDPQIVTQNVTVTVRALPGWDTADVTDNITADLTTYLSPQVWSWEGVIRRYELIQLISNSEGVDFVETLTTPSGDVYMDGYAPLPQLGIATVTVNSA